jgi:hypothetical protein
LGWIQTIGFVVFGLLVEIFTAGLFLNIRRRHLFDLGIGLLTFFGFGLALIGLFRTDPTGALPTWSGRIHVWAAYSVLGLFPVALALLISSIKNDPNWRGLFHYTVVSGILAFCSGSREAVPTTKYKLVWFIRAPSCSECVDLARNYRSSSSSFVNTAKPKSIDCIATSAL